MIWSPSGVGGQYPERAPARAADCSEVALIEAQNVGRPVPFCEDDNRSVRQPDIEICVAVEDIDGARDILGAERRQIVGTVGDLLQERPSDA